MTQVAPRHLAALLVITLIWGLNLIVSKIGLTQVPPMLFTTLRFAVLAALLWPFLRVVPGKMNAMVVAALLSGALNFALLFAGLAIAQNVSAVAIASQLGIPFTTLLSVALLGETVRWRRWTGIAMSFAGVMIIGLDPVVFGFWPSLVLVIASALVGSLGVILIKQLKDIRALELQALVSTLCVVVLLPLSLLTETGQWEALREATWRGWSALVFTAIASSLVAHTTWYWLVARYPVTGLSAVTLLTPIFGIVFSVLVLGDVLTGKMVVGSVVTLAGVLIVLMRDRKLVDTGS